MEKHFCGIVRNDKLRMENTIRLVCDTPAWEKSHPQWSAQNWAQYNLELLGYTIQQRRHIRRQVSKRRKALGH